MKRSFTRDILSGLIRHTFLGLAGGSLLMSNVEARELFTAGMTVDNSAPISRGVNDLREFVDLFQDLSLRETFPGYTPASAVAAAVDLRGIRGTLAYLPNSSELRLTLPDLDLDVRFPGNTREQSREYLKEWLRGRLEIAGAATSGQLEKVLKATAKYSPVEPVAGNPNSLQSHMLRADFDRAINSPRVQLEAPGDEGKPAGVFRVDLDYGASFHADSFDVNTLSLSLGGVINFSDRHWSLLLDGPILGSWTERSGSVMTYPGVGVQYRVTDWWHLTAFARGGIVGSVKVGSLASMYSGTLTSYLHHDFGKISVGWGLMGGFSHTIDDVTIDDYNLTYGLKNYPVETGLDVSGPLGFTVGTRQAAWSAYGNYTHMFGSDLYVEDFFDVGAAFLLRHEVRGTRIDWMRIQVGYLFGDKYHGLSTKVAFNF